MRASLKLVSVIGVGLSLAACGGDDGTDLGSNGGSAGTGGSAGASGSGAGGSGATAGSATGATGGTGAGGAGGSAAGGAGGSAAGGAGGSAAGGTTGGSAGAAGGGAGGTTGGAGGSAGTATGGTGGSGGAAPTHCVIEYDAPSVGANLTCDNSTSCQRVAKTGLGSFESNKRIGPGRLVLRFEADASGAPKAGKVEVLHYYSEFNFSSGPANLAVITIEGCVSTSGGISSACADTFTTSAATALTSAALNAGTLNGGRNSISWDACTYPAGGAQPGSGGYGEAQAKAGTGPGCLSSWANHISNLVNAGDGSGKPPCTGSFCTAVPEQNVNSNWVQYLENIALGANFATATMSMPAYVPVDEGSTTTRFTIVGAINASRSTCVVN